MPSLPAAPTSNSRAFVRLSPPIRPLAVLLPLLFFATFATAQMPAGFGTAQAARQRAVEALLQQVPDSASARRHAGVLSAVPHVAGTPAQTATADYVLREMRRYGLDTSRVSYRVYMPYHDSTVVEIVKPTRQRLVLDEPALETDSTTRLPPWPAMNGYSGAGDVTAPVTFVGYGLAGDYATLDSLGVSVRGRVVIARYGRSYRGIKAREAEARGAVALLLYSDPQDDGYAVGDIYPEGPMRHPSAVQRGSINNGRGDPSSPGWASTEGARHLPLDSMSVSRIPIVPLGYANASIILDALDGPEVPAGWQGGLPFRYHLGAGATEVRVAVWPETGERAYKTIVNTVATLRGSDFPDELVLAGGHRDAWGPGAVDNVSGIVSLLEAARAWGEAAKRGMRPRRTLVFATWDGEEWGLVGSAEYSEQFADLLRRNAVAYLNQDVAAAGTSFASSGTASLHGLLRETARTAGQPRDTVSVYDAWRAAARVPAGAEPRIGDLGGGSDFASFYNFLGIPSIDFGFGGPYGVYHAAYDTYTYVDRMSDPGFVSHASAGRMAALLLGRLANADVVPLDYAAFGDYLRPLIATSKKSGIALDSTLPYGALDSAAATLASAGRAFGAARDSMLGARVPTRKTLADANRILRRVEQELARPEGLRSRAFMKNLVFAADRDNGYANVALPGIAEAIRDRDAARARTEILDLAGRVRAAAERVNEARAVLAGVAAGGRSSAR
jgi:N-acetylated-alpha-linked acidic dipeptidase